MSEPERQIISLLGQAVEYSSPEERAVFLDKVCAGDAARRARVEELLRAYQAAGNFLQGNRPPAEVVNTVNEPITERPGAVIGPYKLMEQIGEGGMGLVFVAEQHHPVRRKVALKVIKPGMDTRQVIARFEAERQALALMDHPNIAKVLDAGTTGVGVPALAGPAPDDAEDRLKPGLQPAGRPYFVMELVKGVPITEYCDQNQVPIRERLELFLHVCQAVQHAHQKGIIHRDIKPSNVLVMSQDGTPLVKVIDFGVAKAIGQQLTDRTIYTQFAQLVGTPLYMSPEQAGQSGLDVDTRSDIYSLGVLLYELLTGTTPFDKDRLGQVGFEEMRRIIREEEPPRPSTRVSTLGQEATAVSPKRKSDPKQLCRLFRGELDWIVMKALEKDRNRRYETASAFAADVQRYLNDEPVQACPPSAWYRFRKFTRRQKTALVMIACVCLAIAGIGGGIGWAFRDREAREQQIAHDQEVREAALDSEVNRLLEEAGPLINQEKWPEALFVVQRADKLLESAGRVDRPGRLVELLKDLTMAKLLEEISREPKRRLKTDAAVIGALEGDPNFKAQEAFAEEEFFWGRGQDPRFAQAFRDYGIDIEALEPAEAAARIRRTHVPEALIQALDEWAAILGFAGSDDKKSGWRKRTETARQADSNSWRNRFREAALKGDRHALEQLAGVVPVRQVSPATLRLLGGELMNMGNRDKAMAVLKTAHRQYPDDFRLNDALGWIYWTRFQPPHYDEALRFYSMAVALRPRLARAHRAVAQVLQSKGAFDEAVAAYSRVIELNPKDVEAYFGRANTLHHQKKPDEAIADYRKVIELNPKYALAHNRLGLNLHAQGKWDEAIACYKKVIELDPNLLYAHHNLGNALYNKKQFDEAIASYQKAIELDPKHPWPHNHLGRALGQQGKLDEAIACFQKAIDLDPKYAGAHQSLGYALSKQGKVDEAIACCKEAIALNPTSGRSHFGMGSVLIELKKWDEAITYCQKAIALEPELARAHGTLGIALHNQGKDAEAFACFKKAVELDPKEPLAHYHLGTCLSDYKHDYDGAIAEFRKAIDLDPTYALAHYGLGDAFRAQKKTDEAITEYRKAIELDPKLALPHNGLGCALANQKKTDEAITEYRKAIQLDPNIAAFHFNLGVELRRKGDLEGAIAAYGKVLVLDPTFAGARHRLAQALIDLGNARRSKGDLEGALVEYRKVFTLKPDCPEAHCNAGFVLKDKGEFRQALEELRRGHELGSKQPNWGHPSAEWVREAEQFVALDAKLPMFQKGEAQPADAAEWLGLAKLCQHKKLHAASARFYQGAFDAESKLVGPNRYDAACVAALAACGKGKDANKLADKDKAQLGGLARGWLKADLALRDKQLASGKPADQADVQAKLRHWLADADFAGVRDPKALAKLPEAERQSWQKLWNDVGDMLKRAQEKAVPDKK
jgi:tetratricopeptide (TPR) repeat protein